MARASRPQARARAHDRALHGLRLDNVGACAVPGRAAPAGAAATQRAEKVRGWRSFFSIPVVDAPITVDVGGRTHVVSADRGGVVDTRVEAELEPGWHELTLSAEGTEAVTATGVRRRSRIGIRHPVRHRRHRDGHRAAPPVPGRVEHLRARRARAHAGGGHGRAVRAARARASPGPLRLPLHRGVERRADAQALPRAQPVPAGRPAAHRLGADARPVVPQRPGAQAPQPRAARRRVPRHALAARSATTGSTTRRSTRRSPASTPTTSPRSRSAQLSPGEAVLAGGRSKAEIPDGAREWMSAPDGAVLSEQLSAAGILLPG